MVRASASAVDSGLIPSLKLVFTAFLFDAQHYKDSVENMPASLCAVLLKRLLVGFSYLGVVNRWLATSKQACVNALIAFS